MEVTFNLRWKREGSIFKEQGQNLLRQRHPIRQTICSVLGERMSDLTTVLLMPTRVSDA